MSDADLVKGLRRVADWLQLDAAHQPVRAEQRQLYLFASTCRKAAHSLEIYAGASPVDQSGGQQRLTLADE